MANSLLEGATLAQTSHYERQRRRLNNIVGSEDVGVIDRSKCLFLTVEQIARDLIIDSFHFYDLDGHFLKGMLMNTCI